MSRIHKYRAWDGMNKKFSYWTMNDLCAWGQDKEKPSAFDDWQEYTGLKDKNGKEIWEGDILAHDTSPFVDKEILTVEWREGFYPLFTLFELSEVIGNLHESPELLAAGSNTGGV